MTEVRERAETVGLAALADSVGLRRVQVFAWRDLEDPEAGGSELYLHEVLRRLADAGLDVVLRTSAVRGLSATAVRGGYRVDRRHGRHLVFPAAGGELLRMPRDPGSAVLEVWNGMPFLSPVWGHRLTRVVLIHHVHADIWRLVMPKHLARVGETIETRLAPVAYRATDLVTNSGSSADDIVARLKVPSARVSVVPPGVDARFTPGGKRSNTPLVVAVGRLVPAKRFELLVDAIAALRKAHPSLTATIVGEGYGRGNLERHIRRRGADGCIVLAGHVDDEALLDLYRRAWVLAATSVHEGWGMTITEAAACGTPAVATRTVGHLDAVTDGVTGLLAEPGDEFVARLDGLLRDGALRRRLGEAATVRARSFSWDATAHGVLCALVEAARRRQRSG
jgi:glycosyltransferase involved in cell wall biosynthesis